MLRLLQRAGSPPGENDPGAMEDQGIYSCLELNCNFPKVGLNVK